MKNKLEHYKLFKADLKDFLPRIISREDLKAINTELKLIAQAIHQ